MAYIEASDTDNAFQFAGGKWSALHAKVESVSDHYATGVSIFGVNIGSAVKTSDFCGTTNSVDWAALRIEKDAGYLDYKHAFSVDDCCSEALMLLVGDGTVISTSKTASNSDNTKVSGSIKLEVDSATSGDNVDRYIWLHTNCPT